MPKGRSHDIVEVYWAGAPGDLVLVCEHASAYIPPELHRLGLSDQDRYSHAAWDPGARGVALRMAELLDSVLVAGGVSRLVYDCNRPPEAPDAVPARSELIAVPGNVGLSAAARASRVATYYQPFRDALAREVAARTAPVIVTIHSFTPVYNNQPREVEIGLLHDSDARLADAMLACAAEHTRHDVQRNAPYGPQDGVTHTLRAHALGMGHLNVMIEIRNDLIASEAQQRSFGDLLAEWLTDALAKTESARDD
ncbi:N-formylglutamate amidohydrolase [Sulfitobacter aestuarii]|uniref:N-formylglutamate amidohydrolase n=1 Tax=Sulfitobacter aestuarii TaxID=2161676 RepID=A0ABW5U4R5_9RHOB